MFTNNRIIYTVLLFIFIATGACKKNEITLTPYVVPTDKAFVRFALFSPGTPAVMIKVNDVKINGANTSGSSGLFPSTVNFPDYAAIPPNGTFRLSLPNAGTANDSVLLFNSSLNVEANKFYSVSLADTGADRTVFAIQDNFGAIAADSFFTIRLINAMPKSPAINLIRVDSTNATTVVRDTIAKNITYKSASNYITSFIAPLRGYSFLRFRTVTTTGMLLSSIAPPSTTYNKRGVTVYASGFANGTGTLVPALSTFIYNQ